MMGREDVKSWGLAGVATVPSLGCLIYGPLVYKREREKNISWVSEIV